MPLSKGDLLSRMKPKVPVPRRLFVEPFFTVDGTEKTAPASLDFHLGNRFVFLRRGRSTFNDPIGDRNAPEATGTEVFIPFGKVLHLHPGQLVLGTTLEWYRFPRDLMAYVVGRSIWGRRGLLVVTASAIQPLTSGTITLELTNVGEVAVVVKPGVAVGQLFFHEVKARKEKSGRPPFSVTHKPIFGQYHPSRVEELLLRER